MSDSKGSTCPAFSQNRTCRTFRSLSDFQTFTTSPASRQAPGASAAPTIPRGQVGGAGIPGWRLELLRRPLRKVVAWRTWSARVNKWNPPVRLFAEKLECGHETEEKLMDVDPPAKRRRCRECGRGNV